MPYVATARKLQVQDEPRQSGGQTADDSLSDSLSDPLAVQMDGAGDTSVGEVEPVMPGAVAANGEVAYYMNRRSDFTERYKGTGLTPPSYYEHYGHKYATRFTNDLRPMMSPEGQAWLDRARLKLQQAIEGKREESNPKFDQLERNDGAFKSFAYGTHADAYWNAGLGSLGPLDLAMVGLTPDIKDLVPWSGISQAADIAVRLGKKWTKDAIDAVGGKGTASQMKALAKEGFDKVGAKIDGLLGAGTTSKYLEAAKQLGDDAITKTSEVYESGRKKAGEAISWGEEKLGMEPGTVSKTADSVRESAQGGVNWVQDKLDDLF